MNQWCFLSFWFLMEIVFVRPSMQPRNFFQGHGESVQKSGYLQGELSLREAAAAASRFKSVSQSVDELREAFTCWEGYYLWYFLFFLILYIVISCWISNESTCIILLLWILLHEGMIIFTTSTSTTLLFRLSFLLLFCWCDYGGWMVPCLSRRATTWFPCAEATRRRR